jgi:hypothetical protein
MKLITARASIRPWAIVRVIAVSVAVFCAVTFTSVATAAATIPTTGVPITAPPPGLSITLTDRTAQTHSGATLTYTASVTNAGANSVKGTLVITIPSYATYTGANSAGKKGADLSWPVTVGGGKEVSEKAIVKVGTIPNGEVRFTTLATLYQAGNATNILVRTADPDTIRGIIDPAHTVRQPNTTKGHPSQPIVAIAIIVGVVLILGIGVALPFWKRRRRTSRVLAAERNPNHDADGELVAPTVSRPDAEVGVDEQPGT